MSFVNRVDAGRRLAERLRSFSGRPVVVLGLPRGGVVVAFEVALALGAPLDVIVVRKLGVPFQPEVAMGAIGEDGVRVVDEEIVRAAGHLKIPYLWMQPGSESLPAFNLARANSMQIISGGPCIMVAIAQRRARDAEAA